MEEFYGWLMDYWSGRKIREASKEELERSLAVTAAGGPGAYTGAFTDDVTGLSVYVEEP